MHRFLCFLVVIIFIYFKDGFVIAQQDKRNTMPEINQSYDLITFSEIRSSDNTLLSVAKTEERKTSHW